MKIIPNEDIIQSSNDNKVVLTTQRVYMTDTVWGNSYNISIFLEDISSIESKYTSRVILIALAMLVLILGYVASDRGSGVLVGSLIIAAAFVLAWFMSKKHVISISSDGGASLNFIVTGMSAENINDFIYNVSLAKAAKVKNLRGA